MAEVTAMAQIWSLARELPYAVGVAKKNNNHVQLHLGGWMEALWFRVSRAKSGLSHCQRISIPEGQERENPKSPWLFSRWLEDEAAPWVLWLEHHMATRLMNAEAEKSRQEEPSKLSVPKVGGRRMGIAPDDRNLSFNQEASWLVMSTEAGHQPLTW